MANVMSPRASEGLLFEGGIADPVDDLVIDLPYEGT